MNLNEGERIETESEEPFKGENEGGEDGVGKRERERSTISFPYSDLGVAIAIARMINDKAGIECTVDQLAAWLGHSVTGGTFRSRYSAARIFGLIETARGGNVRLTELGRAVLSPQKSDMAKAQAFLNVELFSQIYESCKGYALPPATALESQITRLGVAPKQAGRARQTFIKSAQTAQFIDQRTGFFIEPAFPQTNEPDSAEPKTTTNSVPEKNGGSGDNSGTPPPTLDPIIKGLIDRLPKAGSVWPFEQRKLWLKILEDSFQLVYNDDENRDKDGKSNITE